MSDGNQNFKKAMKEINKIRTVPSATVVHMRKEYVKPTKFLLSAMPAKLRRELLQTKPYQCSKVYYHTLAGDNAVEGLFGNTKNTLRRQNLTGRRTAKRAHINFLASARLLVQPGLHSVLEAFRIYREGMQDKVDPSKVFGKNLDLKWLGVGEAY